MIENIDQIKKPQQILDLVHGQVLLLFRDITLSSLMSEDYYQVPLVDKKLGENMHSHNKYTYRIDKKVGNFVPLRDKYITHSMVLHQKPFDRVQLYHQVILVLHTK